MAEGQGIYGAVARAFRMDEATWARHANPWSVWTRVAIAPLLVLAIWSRVWLGWWALLPVTLVAVWAWLNPRAFAAPRSTETWASHGVLGERVWLARHSVPIPVRHRRVPHVLTAASGLGVLVLAWGLVDLDVAVTGLGLAVAMGAKLWFVDRMAWLYADMRDATPEFRAWRRPQPAAPDDGSVNVRG